MTMTFSTFGPSVTIAFTSDDTEPAMPDPAPVEGTPPDADTAPEPENDVVPAPKEEDQP